MAIKKEVCNGGVVQTRHATLLREGELQQADDCILRPGDPAIYSAPGRSSFGVLKTWPTVSCVKNATTALTSTAGFGTDIASVTTTTGSDQISKSGGALSALVVGQTVVGTGIPAGAVVIRLIDTSTVQLSVLATASGTPTITHTDFHPGTFISGTGITTGTFIASITSASALTMSAVATDSLTSTLTFSEKVSGLRAVEFNAGENALMLGRAADKLYTAPIPTSGSITGTFTERLHGLSQNAEATFETIRASAENGLQAHILLTGFDRPKALYLTAGTTGISANIPTTRTLGMKEVKEFVGLALVSGTSWSGSSDQGERYYYFLITEVYHEGQFDEVEGTFSGTPKGIRISDHNTQGIQIQYTPGDLGAAVTPVNDGLNGRNLATAWRIYMAPGNITDPDPPPALSLFTAVQTVPTSVNVVTLSSANPFQSGYANTVSTYASLPILSPGDIAPALGSVVAQNVTSSITTASSYDVAHGSTGFNTVLPGMFVTSPTNNLPYGTYVVSKSSSAAIRLSQKAVATVTETLYFGNSSAFNNLHASVPPNASDFRANSFRNFGIQNQGAFSSSTITGVKVEIKGFSSSLSGGDRGFDVYLNKGGSNGTFSAPKHAAFVTTSLTGGSSIISVGGPSEAWGVSWSPADFTDDALPGVATDPTTDTFGVVLVKSGAAVDITHYIDGVRVTIYAGSDSITLTGDPFRTIVITDQIGTSTDAGARGEPPIATTGDIIDGMVVLNDVNSENSIVASLPGDMDAFPAGYRLPLESRDNDKVTLIRRYGTGGIIGCQNTMKRLNYFPTEKDADFTRGRCFEDIATDHGAVGPMAATLLDLPGRGSVLAYLSYNGLHWTDAITTSILNEDLDWGTLIEPTLIHRSVLRVYPKLYLLALYYVPLAGTRLTKVMYFSYHPIHIKPNFKLPAVGPVSCISGSATSILIQGTPCLFTGHGTNGTVYQEDSGTTFIPGEVSTPTIRTRSYYLAELGFEGIIQRFFLVADASGNSTTGGFTGTLYRQNQGEAMTSIDVLTAANTAIGGVIELFPENVGEVFNFTISKSVAQSTSLRLHYIGFEATALTTDGNG